jgi:pyruvate,water dikinase
MSDLVVSFEDVAARSELRSKVGRKAESLVDLVRWGLPVPPGAVITTDGFERFLAGSGLTERAAALLRRGRAGARPDAARLAALGEAILAAPIPAELAADLDGWCGRRPEVPLAVRSSGLGEDLANASFAGQYVTVLNVGGREDVLRAVKACWASLFTPNVIGYSWDRGIDSGEMRLAVIVQELIPAEKSGVVFTVDPVTGLDREMVIEACFGLGEALVSGAVTPDRYRYDWYRAAETGRVVADKVVACRPTRGRAGTEEVANPAAQREAPVLQPPEVRELVALALDIQTKCGFPVDIEWAQHAGTFSILQSRPITTIGVGGIRGEWTTADFKDGGVSSTVCTPFMWSLYDFIWERAMPGYLKRVHLIDDDPGIVWGDMYYGRPYWNVHEIKECLKRLPGFVERTFDEDLGIEVAYEGNGFESKTTVRSAVRAVRVLLALRRSFRRQMAFCPGFKERQVARIRELEQIVPAALSREELYAFYERLIRDDYWTSESSYFTLIFNNSNLQSLFKDAIKKHLGTGTLGALLGGLGHVSHMLPNCRLWELSRAIRQDPAARDLFARTPAAELRERWARGEGGPYLDGIRDFIQEFRHHSPRELDLTVPRFGEDPTAIFESLKRLLDLEDDQDPAAANERQHAAYLKERERFLAAVPWHRRRSLRRRLEEVRRFLWWREELRDLSTQIYYYVRKFTLAVAWHLSKDGLIRDADDVFMLPVMTLIDLIRGRVTNDEVAAQIRRNRQYFDSFRCFKNRDDLGSRYLQSAAPAAAPGRIMRGVPCSPGVVSGRARVIKTIWDAERLTRGDILITRFTDPGWTPYFGLLLGVATETGGLLSHAAVIAREYGIPAVLAVKDLTTAVRDGSLVTIDGSQGTVALLDAPAALAAGPGAEAAREAAPRVAGPAPPVVPTPPPEAT